MFVIASVVFLKHFITKWNIGGTLLCQRNGGLIVENSVCEDKSFARGKEWYDLFVDTCNTHKHIGTWSSADLLCGPLEFLFWKSRWMVLATGPNKNACLECDRNENGEFNSLAGCSRVVASIISSCTTMLYRFIIWLIVEMPKGVFIDWMSECEDKDENS